MRCAVFLPPRGERNGAREEGFFPGATAGSQTRTSYSDARRGSSWDALAAAAGGLAIAAPRRSPF
jgi:hypothetical protein